MNVENLYVALVEKVSIHHRRIYRFQVDRFFGKLFWSDQWCFKEYKDRGLENRTSRNQLPGVM